MHEAHSGGRSGGIYRARVPTESSFGAMSLAASAPIDHQDKKVPAAMGDADGAAKPTVDAASSVAPSPAGGSARNFFHCRI